jgi:hypothetical protein
MGEANRRKAEVERLKNADNEWLASLNPTERTVAQVCMRAHAQIVKRAKLVGGCYLLAFFLNELLQARYSIQTDLVVGWVNDGTWAGVGSHAWIELGARKIDIALTLTEHPEAQPSGELIVFDRILRRGATKYTYYRDPPVDALTYIEQRVRAGKIERRIVEEKEREHAYVSDMAKTREGILALLSQAPPNRNFEALAGGSDSRVGTPLAAPSHSRPMVS